MLETDIAVSYLKAEDMLHLAQVNGRAETRTKDEIAAMALYTGENYYAVLNRALRDANRKVAMRPHIEFIWLFMNAFRKCEKYTASNQLFRGMKGGIYIRESK